MPSCKSNDIGAKTKAETKPQHLARHLAQLNWSGLLERHYHIHPKIERSYLIDPAGGRTQALCVSDQREAQWLASNSPTGQLSLVARSNLRLGQSCHMRLVTYLGSRSRSSKRCGLRHDLWPIKCSAIINLYKLASLDTLARPSAGLIDRLID